MADWLPLTAHETFKRQQAFYAGGMIGAVTASTNVVVTNCVKDVMRVVRTHFCPHLPFRAFFLCQKREIVGLR